MQNQIRGSAELLITIRTLDRLPRMQCHVCLKDCILGKFFIANFALIWLFSAMRSKMTLERVALGKTKATSFAFKGFFASVCSKMATKTKFSCEFLI